MITRKELLKSKEFWLAKLQTSLYQEVEMYLKKNNLNKTQFALQLGVSKGYISQILNGDFDHKISKFIELSLAIGKAPVLKLEDIDKCVLLDSIGLLDNITDTQINISVNFTKHVKVEKIEETNIDIHSFNKKVPSRFLNLGLKEFNFTDTTMCLS